MPTRTLESIAYAVGDGRTWAARHIVVDAGPKMGTHWADYFVPDKDSPDGRRRRRYALGRDSEGALPRADRRVAAKVFPRKCRCRN